MSLNQISVLFGYWDDVGKMFQLTSDDDVTRKKKLVDVTGFSEDVKPGPKLPQNKSIKFLDRNQFGCQMVPLQGFLNLLYPLGFWMFAPLEGAAWDLCCLFCHFLLI